MFCIYCGKEIADDSKFCPECGTSTAKEPYEKQLTPDLALVSNNPKKEEAINVTTQKTELAPSSLFNIEAKEDAATEQELTFNKRKQIGTVTYKRTKTTIKVTASQLKIDQTAKKFFSKEKHTEKEIPFDTIEKVDIHTVLDFWDTLYAVAFIVLGFFRPVLFLMAALCFWSGYGKEIKITLIDGEIVKIPVDNAKEETKALLGICIEAQNNDLLREISNNTRAKRNFKVFVGIGTVLTVVIVVFAIILFGDKWNNALQDNLTLDGEYAIVLDALLEEGYMYLNFNATDKGLLEFYASDAPEDVISLKYEILPIENDIEEIKTYALKGYNDELPNGIVIFTFYQIVEQTFSVEFSEEIMGVSGIDGVMVPFTEEYGFGKPNESPKESFGAERFETPVIDGFTYPEEYTSILGNYFIALADGYDANQLKSYGLNYLCAYYDLPEIGYAVMDIDDNGTPELLIGEIGEYGGGSGFFFDLYTLIDGTPALVVSSGERDRYYLCKDGLIANEGSSGASNHFYNYYEIEPVTAALLPREAIIYDDSFLGAGPWFYSEAEAWIYDGTQIEIPENVARELIEKYTYANIDFSSLPDF